MPGKRTNEEQTWSIEWPNTPNRDRQSTVFIIHQIGHHTWCGRDHDTTEESSDKANDDQCCDGLCQSAGDNQDCENGQTNYTDRLPSIDLAQRGHEHGPDGKTKQVEGQAKGDDSLGFAEFLTH